MKKFLMLLSIALAACTKDVEPAGSGTGYATAQEALAAVGTLYRTGAPTFYGERMDNGGDVPAAMVGGWMSGLFESEAGGALYSVSRALSLDDGAVGDYAQYVRGEALRAIATCDELMAGIAATPDLTDEQKGFATAQARFFRAFNNFYLARAFGDVSKYDLIVSDLAKAADALPVSGALTRAAALTLLADVRLTMSGYPALRNCYGEAAAAARAVIAGGRHSLLANDPEQSAYNKLREQSETAECIFNYAVQQTNRSLFAFCLPKEAADWGVVKTVTSNVYMPNFMAIYDPVDDLRARERQFFHSFAGYEKGTRTVIQTFSPKPYWWFDRQALFETGKSSRGVIVYRYAEVLLIAAEAIAMSEGVTAEAVGYLADVRARASLGAGREKIASDLAALGVSEFVEQVWAERLREFPFEFKAWTDIQRTRKYPVWGDAASSGNVAFAGAAVTFVDVIGAASPAGTTFYAKHLQLPSF